MTSPAYHQYVMPDGSLWTEFYRTDRGYLLRFPGLADFEMSAVGQDVRCLPCPGTEQLTVDHLFINQVYPLMVSRQGRPAFHASVVVLDEGAVAFLGESGLGKSTLAAYFCRVGGRFLTDDGMMIEEREDGPWVLPSHPSVRLWDDSAEALADAGTVFAPELCFTNKSRLLAGESLPFCAAPKPLRAAFFLQRNAVGDVEIVPLQGAARMMAWLANSFLLDMEDQGMLASHFGWVGRIAMAVPSFTLDYPRDYDRLPEVAKAVTKMISKRGV